MHPGPGCAHGTTVCLGGYLGSLAHHVKLGIRLEQTQLVQQIVQKYQLFRRLSPLAGAAANLVEPAANAPIQRLIAAQGVIKSARTIEQLGYALLKFGQSKRLIGAEITDTALGPGAVTGPDLQLRVARRAEQYKFAFGTAGNQQHQGIGLVEAGQVIEVTVLTKAVLGITVARFQVGGGYQRHTVSGQLLQQATAAPR